MLSPPPGSSLLAARYHEVPILSEAWGIGHIGLPFVSDSSNPDFISAFGLQLPLRTDTDFVASLRYTPAAHVLSGGAVHLRVEEIAPDPDSAIRTVNTLINLLNVLRGFVAEQALNQQPTSPHLRRRRRHPQLRHPHPPRQPGPPQRKPPALAS